MVARRTFLTGSTALGLLTLAGCRSAPDDPGTTPSPSRTTPSASPDAGPPDPRVAGTVAEGLNVPWSIVFLASGDALVSQRDDATIVRVTADGGVTDVGAVPGQEVRTGAEGGLLGLALDPDDDTVLYAYLSTPQDNRVVRMRYADDELSDATVVLEGIPLGPGRHQGGRLAFDPEGRLFVSTGDAGSPELAQERASLAGKILRVDRDGDAADGNPFDDRVWSYGHRNVQGLAFDSEGRLWASEFGDKGADELNLIERGGNYGWPRAEGESDDPDLVAPKVTWPTEDCSPAGIAIARDTVFMAALRGQRLWTVPIDGDAAAESSALLEQEYGRLREIVVAPDDSLWLATSNTDGRVDPRDGDDRIVRLAL